MSIGLRHWAHKKKKKKKSSTRTGTGALIVQTMLTVVTQIADYHAGARFSGDRIAKSHECKSARRVVPKNLGPLE